MVKDIRFGTNSSTPAYLTNVNNALFFGANNGPNGEELWKYDSTTTGVYQTISDLPQNYSLSQNYPNPFNPTTEIRYQISEVSHVMLKVFDLLGREVSMLVNERLQPGSYETTFNAGAFASGVYLYRLEAVSADRQAGDFIQTKKLLLLR